ncbi:hypothetical protein [Streptomyces sp. NPDC058657]|uniref:hypothetical protein n=1 Tax=unclassified Streptomyces TaxID=2593676 RepID=UPI00364FE948
MASSSSGIVAGLTAGALAVVGFLAYQASANVPDTVAMPSATASPTVPQGKGKTAKPSPLALPANSGTGTRVVYSLSGKRVWLVDTEAPAAARQKPPTYPVAPSAVSPAPDTYRVSTRSLKVTGSDGKPVEHVVRFTSVDGVTVGFSAAVDGTMPGPGASPQEGTGAVRMTRADANRMWEFATVNVKVVVVP